MLAMTNFDYDKARQFCRDYGHADKLGDESDPGIGDFDVLDFVDMIALAFMAAFLDGPPAPAAELPLFGDEDPWLSTY